jgi:nitrogen fixation protein NifU and related proteins
MSDLGELYQQVILDHNRKPRNFRVIEDATGTAEGYNPLCGDELKVFLRVNSEGTIEDVSFEGSGCAISKASASLMTTNVKGKTVGEVEILFNEFHRLVTGDLDSSSTDHHLGRLAVFGGVSEFPARVKCASLAWHTLKGALAGGGTVSTE